MVQKHSKVFRSLTTGTIVVGAVAIALGSSLAGAAQRSFVATNGVDTGTCGPTAPCRGFAYAISQTSAGGEVIALNSGGYGPVSITQSVSIIAPQGVYAGVSVLTGTAGITINAPGATVVLRGLSINNQGTTTAHGVWVQNAALVVLRSLEISGFANNHYGIVVDSTAVGVDVSVFDSIVRQNQTGLLTLAGSTQVENSHFIENIDNGVSAREGSSVVVRNSTAAHNGSSGFRASSTTASCATLGVENSDASFNAFGISVGGVCTTLVVSGSRANRNSQYGFYNAIGVGNFGSRKNNTTFGNTVSDVMGVIDVVTAD